MSRIGRMPIVIPSGVEIRFEDHKITVKGPKGELSRTLHTDIKIERGDGQLMVTRPSDSPTHRALHGLTRTLVANMVTGITTGFAKTIEIYGVGYRAQKQGRKLTMQMGYSHPVEIEPPAAIEFSDVETFTPTSTNSWLSARFSVRGANRELVGEIAAAVRAVRPVEPYKGKGIKYAGEQVRRKAGKAGKAAAKGKGR